MRVQDLAKKYKMEKKEFLELLNNIGIKGKKTVSALSTEEMAKFENYIGRIKERFTTQQKQKEKIVDVKPPQEKKGPDIKKEPPEKKLKVEKKEPLSIKKKVKTALKKAEKKIPVGKKPKAEVPIKKAKKVQKEKPVVKKVIEKEGVPPKKIPPSAPQPEIPPKEIKVEEKQVPAPVQEPPVPPPIKPVPVVVEEKKTGEKEEPVLKIKPETKPQEPVKKKIVLEGTESIKEFAEKTNIPPAEIIKHFFTQGFMININQSPGKENLQKACEIFGIPAEFKKIEKKIELRKIPEEKKAGIMIPRAPVVTIMGHVDHGKTTILDAIRKSRIAEKEYGQITQKIGAYKVDMGTKGSIVFLDTPGHESFTAMRARGTLVTDIVVLVVAADEGVKPQTIEAINHAKSANVSIVVAVNKIDKPNINLDRVKKQLSEYQLVPEEWGGDTVFVNVSGLTGQGINELLEMIVLEGEMLELKDSPEGPAEGVVIESFVDRTRGPIINVLIRSGTLRIGDPFIAGNVRGKVRAIIDDWNRKLDSAGPSTPVEILGGDGVAVPGEQFRTVKSEKIARQLFHEREDKGQKEPSARKVTLQDLSNSVQKGEFKQLNLIIKTDYAGTEDAIRDIISKLPESEIKISIIHSETGAISESDILLASASNAVVVGFNVPLTQQVEEMAKAEGVEVRTYRIIYELADDIRRAVEGMLEPEEQEVLAGQSAVRKVFNLSDKSKIAGCIVVDGKMVRGSIGKVIRSGSIIFQGTISSLKRFKENVKEVRQNTECGIGIANFTDFREGDIIQSYIKTKTSKKL